MLKFLIVPALSVLAVACASHEGLDAAPRTTAETLEPDAPRPTTKVATASIASVQMIEDCKDPAPAPAPAKPAAERSRPAAPPDEPPPQDGASEQEIAAGAVMRVPGDSVDGSFPDMCTQSTLQIAFEGQGDAPGPVEIRSIRVLTAEGGKAVGTVEARLPMAWIDERYAPWDGVIPPQTDLKASYRISVPDWGALERKLGKSSYGPMFMLEVELSIDGQTQTIRSPQFPREEPHVIVT